MGDNLSMDVALADVFRRHETNGFIKLELGSYGGKKEATAIGIDLRAGPGVDIQGDALDVLRRLPASSVQSIYSAHFLEHVPDLSAILSECTRVLADGAEFRAIAPHFSNPYFYSDPTHLRFFGLYTFCYLADDNNLYRRKTPRYAGTGELVLDAVSMGFIAPRPFYLRYAALKAFGLLVNANRATQEFYEGVLSRVISCYEIDYRLHRRHRSV